MFLVFTVYVMDFLNLMQNFSGLMTLASNTFLRDNEKF